MFFHVWIVHFAPCLRHLCLFGGHKDVSSKCFMALPFTCRYAAHLECGGFCFCFFIICEACVWEDPSILTVQGWPSWLCYGEGLLLLETLLYGSVCLSLCRSCGVLITVALSWVWYLVAQVCQTCSLFSWSSWLFLVPLPFHINFVSACQFPPTINLLWFWLRLHWVQILVGGKEHVYSIVVSQSMNMVCSSICLDPC